MTGMAARSSLSLRHRTKPRAQAVASLAAAAVIAALLVTDAKSTLAQAQPVQPTTDAVTTGTHHSCALRTDGTITCWGDLRGQVDVPGGSFSAVTAGLWHSCALRTDGTITCWGFNNYGQADAPGGSFSAVTAGDRYSCGLRTDGTITCWGDNEWGRADAPGGSFSAVTAGHFHSCGLRTDSTVTCWGDNAHGQADAPGGSFSAVTTGIHHSCGLRTDSTVTCWGTNANGQADAPGGSFTAVTADGWHSCGLRTDSTVTCWGENAHGQADAPGGSFSAVTAGRWHSCALRTDGTITCWGDNARGQADAPRGRFGPQAQDTPTTPTTATPAGDASAGDTSDAPVIVDTPTGPVTEGVPGVVGELTATPLRGGGVLVDWSAPSDDGGSAIVRYEVTYSRGAMYYRGSSRDAWHITKQVRVTSVFDRALRDYRQSLATSHMNVHLYPGVGYRVSVTAVNGIGSGQSATTDFWTFDVPDVPGGLTATPVRGEGVEVRWSAPSDGGSPILYYRVEYSRGPLTDHPVAGTDSARTITRRVSDISDFYEFLYSDVAYTVSVRAVNGVGSGDSATAAFTIMQACPAGDKFETRKESAWKVWTLGRRSTWVVARQDFSTINGDEIQAGDKGGKVSDGSNLSQSGCSWIFEGAEATGGAHVGENAVVHGDARVYDNAQVYGNAEVYDKSRIYGDAQVYGNARISGRAQVYGNAKVYDDAVVYGRARVYDTALVYERAQVFGEAQVLLGPATTIFDPSRFEHLGGQVYGDAKVYDKSKVYGYAKLFGSAEFSGTLEASDGEFDGEQEHVRAGRELYRELFTHFATELRACAVAVGSYNENQIPEIVRNLLNEDPLIRALSEIHVQDCQQLRVISEVLNFFIPKLTWWDVAFALALSVTAIRGSFYLKSLIELAQTTKPLLDLSKIPSDVKKWEVDATRMFEEFKRCEDLWNSAEPCVP